MVKMEKYCTKCRKSFDDLEFNNCPLCTTELIEREKPSPIPQKLRHKIFVRDGYRCRECGKSNKETSLEIDHIHPRSKGGRTIEENLQVLCTECNRAKKDDEWNDTEIEHAKNALSNLEDQLQTAENDLKVATTEEEIYRLKAKIKDLKKNKIPEEENKLNKLIQEEICINNERKAQQKENKRRKNLFNKLYVQLEGELLLGVCNHFSLTEESDEDNIRLLVSRYDEQTIFNTISSIKQELEEEYNRKELFNKLNNILSNEDIRLFQNKFSITGSREDIINYLINKFDEEEIELQRIKLHEEEQLRIRIEIEQQKELTRKKKYDEFDSILNENFMKFLSIKLNINERNKKSFINYLIDNNYDINEIKELKKKYDEFKAILNKKDISLISSEISLNKSTFEDVITYLINNNYDITKLKDLKTLVYKKEFFNELYSKLNSRQIELICEFYSIEYLDNESSLWKLVDNHKKEDLTITIHSVNKKIEKENLFIKLKENTDPTLLKTLCFRFPKLDSCDEDKILNYLVDKYPEQNINSLLSDEIRRKKELSYELHDKIYTNSIFFLLNYYGIPDKNKQETIEYLVNNFTNSQIDYIILTVKRLFKKDGVKRNPINGKYILEKYSQEEIKKHLDDVYALKGYYSLKRESNKKIKRSNNTHTPKVTKNNKTNTKIKKPIKNSKITKNNKTNTIDKSRLFGELMRKINDDKINTLYQQLSLKNKSKHYVISYLVDNYSKNEIESILKQL